MSQNQNQLTYPSAAPDAYVAPPPPGYPMKDLPTNHHNTLPVETKSRGDGFWKGCCAALCCCCMLDACF
ncbi:Protein CYSTEINE-RICH TRANSMEMBRANE MODULE 6 [Euphorbia peplus]|nr:Protein CYSTEINE-RICH TRANSMEMBRANE MODULE 6 [Euphorbia peplus]